MERTLTAKGAATRERIVAGAAARIREHGVAATTLDDIRERTATSKSQLFHYFPGGREELLLAVARFEADRVLADQQPQLGALTSWEAWEGWREKVLARYRAQGRACPLGGLLTQVGRATPGAQAVVAELMARWEAELAAGVVAMQRGGFVDPGLDAAREAAALLAGLQGGVLMLMTTGRLTYLQAALDVGLERLRRAGGERPVP
ncbi:TetR/AcrR family transcriptional regulator [Parafrankia sp. FMc2]|uniref:TetR/AcrR family transcriptional regulator n=1 Tax=Parafrankia sp. FMc2 TaxID=3233196 RepID=UPI0034D6861B